MMKELADSILITLGQDQIKSYGGFKNVLTEWRKCNGSPLFWYQAIHQLPKQKVVYVYWVIGGKIRYKSKLFDIDHGHNGPMIKHTSPNWLVCFDFEHIPKLSQLERKGFQGFRYFCSEARYFIK